MFRSDWITQFYKVRRVFVKECALHNTIPVDIFASKQFRRLGINKSCLDPVGEICRDAQRSCLQMHGLTKCILQHFRRLDSWWWMKGGQNGREGCWKPEGGDAGGQSPPVAEEAHLLLVSSSASYCIQNPKEISEKLYGLSKVTCLLCRPETCLALRVLISVVSNTEDFRSWAAHACQLSASNLRTVQPCKGACR